MAVEENFLDEFSPEKLTLGRRRRALLPVWIRIFIWFFMILGVIAIPLLILGLKGSNFQVALYGLQSDDPTSFVGIFLAAIFLFKGVVAFFLWFEKKWAIMLGLIDAIAGILICLDVMLNFPIVVTDVSSRSFRMEIIFLTLYLVKLFNIRTKWELGRARIRL
jgi:hypothetical protein